MPARDYGTRGCLIVIGSLLLLGVVLFVVIDLITRSGPEAPLIRSMSENLIKQAVTARPVDALTVTQIHTRRERYSFSVHRWKLVGTVGYRAGTAGPPVEEFDAVVETVCDEVTRQDCWALRRLTVGTRLYISESSPD